MLFNSHLFILVFLPIVLVLYYNAAENKPLVDVEWTRRQLREAIQWTEARLRLHLGELMRLEYVGVKSGRFGQRFTHRLLVDPEEIELGGRWVPGLKSVEQIREEANLAGIGGNLASQNGHLTGQNGHLVATSQPHSCEVPTTLTPRHHNGNGHHGPSLAAKIDTNTYVLRGNGSRRRQGVTR